MSAEHFTTFLSCDMRTALDGKSVEYKRRQEGQPRRISLFVGWVECDLFAHNTLDLAAQTVREQPCEGISGDLPAHREQAARIIEAASQMVRLLALDAAYDSKLTESDWADAMDKIQNEVSVIKSKGETWGDAYDAGWKAAMEQENPPQRIHPNPFRRTTP